jgi:hypothetical protein
MVERVQKALTADKSFQRFKAKTEADGRRQAIARDKDIVEILRVRIAQGLNLNLLDSRVHVWSK